MGTDGYTVAEAAFKTAFEQHGVVNDIDAVAGDNLPKRFEASVGISGSPDPATLPGNAQALDANTDRFDAMVKVPGLRALNEPQMCQITLKVLRDQFAKVILADGSTLADAYDFSGNATPAEGKIKPGIAIDTSVHAQTNSVQSNDAIHILCALPKGVSHTQVVAGIAGIAKAPVIAPQFTTPPEVKDAAMTAEQVQALAAEGGKLITPPAPGFAQDALKRDITPVAPLPSAVERAMQPKDSQLAIGG